ncbi:MAG: 8-oxo-dGTP diphosphatase [Myxococcota bacterium]|jgi:8-oxo-dGTP diphosphatase
MSHHTVRVVSAEIQRDGHYLLTQRLSKAVMPDLWEFPGGRVQQGETDEAALERALERRIGICPRVGSQVLEVTHNYDDYSVVLVVYQCEVGTAEPAPLDVQDTAWVAPENFSDYPFPAADEATVHLLINALDA